MISSSIPEAFRFVCKALTTAASLSATCAVLTLTLALLTIPVLLVASAALFEQPAATTTSNAPIIILDKGLRENRARAEVALEKEGKNIGISFRRWCLSKI